MLKSTGVVRKVDELGRIVIPIELRRTMGIEEKDGYLVPVPRVVTVSELAKALNAIGATPRDLIAIFNALKKAGALQAKLEIM